MASLLDRLREAGAHEQAAALLARDPAAHASLDDPGGVAHLLDGLREAGADEQAAALASRAAALLARDPAARVSLDDPGAVAVLLGALREAGADEQAAALAARSRRPRLPRRPGRRGRGLLAALREAGADEQAAALAGRAAAHVSLDDPGGVADLLGALREAGAEEQAAALAGPRPPPTSPSTTRAPWPPCWTRCGRRARTSRPPRWPTGCRGPACSGCSSEQQDGQDRFRFGREADGSPSAAMGLGRPGLTRPGSVP